MLLPWCRVEPAFSGPEHRLGGSNSNCTGILFSRGDHGDGAQGTARGQKKRKARSENWSDEKTEQLLEARLKFEEDASMSKGRRRMRGPRKWETISGSVDRMTAEECKGRSETLTKSFNAIKEHCALQQKQFGQLREEFKRLELATKMNLIGTIKCARSKSSARLLRSRARYDLKSCDKFFAGCSFIENVIVLIECVV